MLNRGLKSTCEKMFASLWQRLGRLSPSLCITGLKFDLIVPEDDEIHVSFGFEVLVAFVSHETWDVMFAVS